MPLHTALRSGTRHPRHRGQGRLQTVWAVQLPPKVGKTAYLAEFEAHNIQDLASGEVTKEPKENIRWSSVSPSPYFSRSAPAGRFSICSRCRPDTLGTQGHPSASGQQWHWTFHHTRMQAEGPTTPEVPCWHPLALRRDLLSRCHLLEVAAHHSVHHSQQETTPICHCQLAHIPSQATFISLVPFLCRHHLHCHVSSFLSLNIWAPGLYQHRER